MNRSKLLMLAVPIAGISLIGLVLVFRGRGPSVSGPERPSKPAAVGFQMPVSTAIARPEPSPALAPEKTVARSMDQARIQSTFQNFRTAVATGNVPLEDSLRKVLLRDREIAVRLAEEDLRKASAPLDRDIALKTMDSLRK